jgi:hypothetical protein
MLPSQNLSLVYGKMIISHYVAFPKYRALFLGDFENLRHVEFDVGGAVDGLARNHQV